jgi:hypothetical protein
MALDLVVCHLRVSLLKKNGKTKQHDSSQKTEHAFGHLGTPRLDVGICADRFLRAWPEITTWPAAEGFGQHP